MKEITCTDERTENYYLAMQFPLSSTEHFSIFQVIVLVLIVVTLLFWF